MFFFILILSVKNAVSVILEVCYCCNNSTRFSVTSPVGDWLAKLLRIAIESLRVLTSFICDSTQGIEIWRKKENYKNSAPKKNNSCVNVNVFCLPYLKNSYSCFCSIQNIQIYCNTKGLNMQDPSVKMANFLMN